VRPGIAALLRLGCDPLVRTLSVTEEVAALLTSRRWFTEVSHEAHKPGIGIYLAGTIRGRGDGVDEDAAGDSRRGDVARGTELGSGVLL
jgi:hypothetical protein